MFSNPKGDKRSKKERKRDKYPKYFGNDSKAIEMMIHGMSLPNNEPKRSTIVHTDFFNDFVDDFDDETI